MVILSKTPKYIAEKSARYHHKNKDTEEYKQRKRANTKRYYAKQQCGDIDEDLWRILKCIQKSKSICVI